MEVFRLIYVFVNALPNGLWILLKSSILLAQNLSTYQKNFFSLNGQNVLISEWHQRKLLESFESELLRYQSGQKRYKDCFKSNSINLKEIYTLPYRVISDTKVCEFQFSISNRYLPTSTQNSANFGQNANSQFWPIFMAELRKPQKIRNPYQLSLRKVLLDAEFIEGFVKTKTSRN